MGTELKGGGLEGEKCVLTNKRMIHIGDACGYCGTNRGIIYKTTRQTPRIALPRRERSLRSCAAV